MGTYFFDQKNSLSSLQDMFILRLSKKQIKETNYSTFSKFGHYLLLLGALLIILSPSLPNHYLPWRTFHGEFIAFAGLWCFFVAYYLSFSTLDLPVKYFFLFLLTLVPWLQFLSGMVSFSGDALIASLFLLGFAFSVWVGRGFYRGYDNHWYSVLAVCLIAAAFLSLFCAFYQWLELEYMGVWVLNIKRFTRLYGNLGQPNNFATLLCLGMASLIYLKQRGILSNPVFYMASCFLILGIALSGSRTPMIIFIAFFVWWFWKRKTVAMNLGWSFFLLVPLVYLVFFALIPEFNKFYFFVEELPPGKKITSIGARKAIYLLMLDAIWNGPIWGYGWNQVSLAQFEFATSNPPAVYTQYSHNFFLDLLLWNGPLLGGLLITCICFWGIKSAVCCKSAEVWFGLLCILVVLSHSMTEYPHAYAFFLLPMGLLVGSIDADLKKEASHIINLPRWGVAFLVVGSGWLLFGSYLEYRKAEEDTWIMRRQTALLLPMNANINVPTDYWFNQIQEYNALARKKVKPGISEEEVESIKKIVELNAFPPAIFRYALALYYIGKEEEAQQTLLLLRQLYSEHEYKAGLRDFEQAKKVYSER